MSIGTGTDLGGTGLGGLGVGGSGSGGVDPASDPVGGPLEPHALPARRASRIQLPRSPKIIAGLVMLAVFLILAIIGPIVAPYDPSASLSTTNGTPQPPSAAHWLGTTQTQQDVFSQLLAGGRSTILVAVLAGVAATVLSVVIGVCAGYLHGRWADDLLSMLANFFLVLPALPLLIVIFGFLPPVRRQQRRLIGRDHRHHRLGLGRPGAARPDAVAAHPGLRRVGAHHRRARLADHQLRDPAQPDAGRRLLVPVHRAVRGGHVHRARLPRPGQPGALELGLDAVRGAERRTPRSAATGGGTSRPA